MDPDTTLMVQPVILRMKERISIIDGCCTQCILYLVYTVLGVGCSWCMWYTVCAVHSVCCTGCALYMAINCDQEKEIYKVIILLLSIRKEAAR